MEGFANLNKIEICGQSITDLEIILIKETKGGYYRYPTDIKISSNNDLNSLKLIGVEEQAEVINNLFLTNSPNLNKFEFQNCLLKLESDFVIENFGNKNCTLPFLRFLQQPLKCSNKGDKNELLIKKILSFIEEIVWEIKKQKDQIVNLQTQLNLLENEKKNHSSEKSKTEEETNNFIQRIGQLKDDIANLKHDIQENSKKSQKEKEQLTANYSQEKQKLEQQTKEKEQKIKNLENKIKSKENKAVDLEKRIQESQEQINSLQAEINQQKQKLSLKDGDYDLLLSEKTKLEKKIKDLQDRNSTATITNEKEFSLDKVFGDKYKKY